MGTKTWRLKGFWPNGCNIMLVGGEPLAAIPRHEIPENKGGEIEVSVDMQSPLQPGRFKSFWRLVDKTGKRFGDKLWADIVVVTKAADAEEPEEKNDIKPEAKFVADVSIPDETVLEEGQLFTKTWRLKGSWPRGCGISFVGG